MRSFLVTAVCLSLISSTYAHVPHSYHELIQRETEIKPANRFVDGLRRWFDRLLRRNVQPRQNGGVCYEDGYYDFANSVPAGMEFCQLFMNYTNVTITVDYTPTSLVYNTVTTRVHTEVELTRVTPVTTTTVTVTPHGSQAKRDAEPQITAKSLPREERIKAVIQRFRRQNAPASGGSSSISSALSSACSCQDYTGPTHTVSYTDAAEVETVNAFVNTYTTTTTSRTAAVSVLTKTVTAQDESTLSSSASASTSTSTFASVSASSVTGTAASPSSTPAYSTGSSPTTGGPAPTGTAFACPDANGTTVSQMIGSEVFDYTVLCDIILGDTDFYSALNYATFGECVAACSLGDDRFDFPVCQGVSYYANVQSSSGGNCHLKSSANQTFSSPGIDAAILTRVKAGVANAAPSGGPAQQVPFALTSPTLDAVHMSSAMAVIMGNSTQALPTVTPVPIKQSGLLANAQIPITAFSTFVSGGTTYSTGHVSYFSTMYPNGSWTAYYYSDYEESWTAATTVAGSGATETSVAGGNNGGSSSQQDQQYSVITITNTTTFIPTGYNITEVISDETFWANDTEISSAATTHYYSYQTAAGGSGGGSAVGPASGSAGFVTSTSVYSTRTVVYNSYATSGGTAYGGVGGPASTSASVVTNTYGTAGGNTFGGTGGVGSPVTSSTSGISDGRPTSTGTFTPGTGLRTPGSFPSESTSSPDLPPFTQPGYGRPPPPSTSSSSETFSNTGTPRQGSYSTTNTASTPISGIDTSSVPTYPSSSGGYTPPGSIPVSGTGPSGSSPSSTSPPGNFSNTGTPRQGSYSTTSTASTPISGIDTSSVPTFPSGSGGYSLSSSAPVGPVSTGPSSGVPSSSPPESTSSGSKNWNSTTSTPPETSPSSNSATTGTGQISSSIGTGSSSSPIGTGPSSSPSGPFSPSTDNRSLYSTGSSTSSGSSSSPSTTPTGSSSGGSSSTSSGLPTGPFNPSTGNRTPGRPGSSTSSTKAASCTYTTTGTTTVTTTVTMTQYGCYSNCPPGAGYYGGPQTFGPPVQPTA